MAQNYTGVPIGFQNVFRRLENRVKELDRQNNKLKDRVDALEKAAKPAQAPRRGRAKKDAALNA